MYMYLHTYTYSACIIATNNVAYLQTSHNQTLFLRE